MLCRLTNAMRSILLSDDALVSKTRSMSGWTGVIVFNAILVEVKFEHSNAASRIWWLKIVRISPSVISDIFVVMPFGKQLTYDK